MTSVLSIRPARAAFSLVELLAVVAIILILLMLLLPLSGQLRERANRSVCASNLRQIASATALWAGDHDGAYPGGNATVYPQYGIDSTFAMPDFPMGVGFVLRDNYVRSTDARIFYCPSWKHPYGQFNQIDAAGVDINQHKKNAYGGWPASGTGGPIWHRIISYHYRSTYGDSANQPPRPSSISKPAGSAFLADHWTRREALYGVDYGHKTGYNAIFLDGHTVFTPDRAGYMQSVNIGFTHGSWAFQETIWRAFFDQGGRY